jgi:hypothetical protein
MEQFHERKLTANECLTLCITGNALSSDQNVASQSDVSFFGTSYLEQRGCSSSTVSF